MDKCEKTVYDKVATHCEEIAWKYCALSEVMLRSPVIWLGSSLSPGVTTPAVTLPNEATVAMNWDLPLTEAGQKFLFTRLFNDYHVDAGMLEPPAKRAYRKKDSELMALRKIAGFWSQVCDFVQSQMNPTLFSKFEEDLLTTQRRDDELLSAVELQPACFAMSQLKSVRELAVKSKQNEDSVMAHAMSQQYADLRAQQFRYFETGLANDWKVLEQVRGALSQLETATHVKKVLWLAGVAQKCEEGVDLYMQKFTRIDPATNVDDAMKAINSYIKAIRHEDSTQDVLILGICDFNRPESTLGDGIQTSASLAARLNGIDKDKACVIVVLPERAKETCKRGLSDEESAIERELWAKQQYCDKRWIFPFNLPRIARNHSNMRRWMTGRLVVDNEGKSSNEWLLSSELSLAGRPLADGFEIGELPLQRDLVLLESVHPNEDLRTADRQRPGEEQVQGQKGVKIAEVLIKSAFADVENLVNRSVLIVNLSGYVEDTGIAAINLKTSFPKTRYISFNLDDSKAQAFGKARVANYVSDLWMKKAIELPGVTYDGTPPSLTPTELAAIPGGLVASGQLDKLQLTCCVRSGAAVVIKDDAKREWTSSDDSFHDRYKALHDLHNTKYATALTTLLTPLTPGGTPAPEPQLAIEDGASTFQPGVIETMDSLDALKAANPGKEIKQGASEYANVVAIAVADTQIWLMCAEKKTIPAKTVMPREIWPSRDIIIDPPWSSRPGEREGGDEGVVVPKARTLSGNTPGAGTQG